MPNEPTVNLKEKVRRLSASPGVYLMKDRLGKIIYVGKAKNLKKRVSTYFQTSRRITLHPKIRSLMGMIFDFEVIEVKSETEALLLEGKLIKHWKPRYNTDFTDDKRFLLVRVDGAAEIPKFRLTRNRVDEHSRYFGPFAHAGHLRKTLHALRRQFGIVLADANPQKMPDGRYRLYADARAEIYGHENLVDPATYRTRVEAACAFLEGRARERLEEMKEEMKKAAENLDFEKAAALRDTLLAMKKTLSRNRRFIRDPLVRGDHTPVLESLRDHLGLRQMPARMDCFDISHISGTFAVASVVHFRNGKPDKKEYRRFRIKSFVGNDDFRAMEEVVGRRYRRLHEEGRSFPDLIVIDGGKGQVAYACQAFTLLDLEPPPIIGLAKKEETIVFADGREDLRLPHRDPALRLLQRLRDEAHRFANTYNADLRSRRLKESILDDFPGLGPKRKAALLDHFGGLPGLRRATAAELATLEGIGPRTAEALVTFLRGESPSP